MRGLFSRPNTFNRYANLFAKKTRIYGNAMQRAALRFRGAAGRGTWDYLVSQQGGDNLLRGSLLQRVAQRGGATTKSSRADEVTPHPSRCIGTPSPLGEGSLFTNLLPGEKVLRYEADEGSLLST